MSNADGEWGSTNGWLVLSVTPDRPSSVATGDLDRDGLPNAIVSERGGDVRMYTDFNDPASPANLSMASSVLFNHPEIQEILPGDVDGDGDLDLVVVAKDGAGDDLLWFENVNGDASSWSASHTIAAVAAGAEDGDLLDIDRDGDLDLLVAAGTDGTVTWYANPGDGTGVWPAYTLDSGRPGVSAAVAGDLDGDGDLDVVTLGDGTIAFHENIRLHHSVTFPNVTAGPTWYGPARFEPVDIDGDGDLDLLGKNHDSLGAIVWSVNHGDAASWSAADTIADGFGAPRDVTAADLDLDGDLDPILTRALSPGIALTGHTNVNGDGSNFSEFTIDSGGSGCWYNAVGDFDHDGDPDVLRGCNASRSVRLSLNNRGSFTTCELLSGGSRIREVTPVDLDGDGDLDIVVSGGDPDRLSWLENEEQGCSSEWTERVIAEDASGSNHAVGDFDGDGDVDVVSPLSTGGLRLFINDDPGSVDPNLADDLQVWSFDSIDPSFTGGDPVADDVDQDGDMDIVGGVSGSVRVPINDGGVFTASTWASGSDLEIAELADMNGDGRLDLVVSYSPDDNNGFADDRIDLAFGERQQLGLSSFEGSTSCGSPSGPIDDCAEEQAVVVAHTLDLEHTYGRDGDAAAELAFGDLYLTDGFATPLDDGTAALAFASLALWRDDGDNVFDAGLDSPVVTATTFSLVDGVLSLALPGGDPDLQVAPGETGRFYFVATIADSAFADGVTDVGIDLELESGAVAVHEGTAVPVLADGGATVSTLSISLQALDSDDDGDPDTTDCDDANFTIYTGAPELCDAVDSDCDGSLVDGTDPDFDTDGQPDCIDLDDDEDGDPDATDCEPLDASIFTGQLEFCDAIDSDCDGDLVDTYDDFESDGDPDCNDLDDDNDGDPDTTDCAFHDDTIFNGQVELCDAIDSDCDGSLVDEYDDTDGDLDPDCTDPDDDEDRDPDGTDCAPLDETIYTSAPELCDAIDSDCDGSLVDEFDDLDGDGEPDCIDLDDDGDGDPNATDCAPTDDTVYAGAPEACDAIDSDCDGSFADDFDDFDGDDDPDCTDLDDDGDADPDATDCAPLDPAFHAAATELCDTIDQDCDGDLVDGFADSDADGDPDCNEIDADDDGLLDAWEDANGLDPTDPSDASSDADGDGRDAEQEETDDTDPNVWDGPDAPVALSPVDGFRPDTLTPELVAANATSPRGDALTYTFEIYTDEALSTLVAFIDGVSEGVDQTAWTVDAPLTEDADHWWRAAASDAFVQGAWSEPALFAPDILGTVIPQPTAIFPLIGDDMEPGDAFAWSNVSSADGLPISYRIELLEETGVAVINSRVVPHDDASDPQEWTPVTGFGLQLGVTYGWQVVAIDSALREGDPSLIQVFGYGTGNDPPTNPVFADPLDGARVDSLLPRFEITRAVDPEGGDVTHVVRLDTSPDFDSPDAFTFTEVTNGPGTIEIQLTGEAQTLLEETDYHASVVATDLVELSSAVDSISFYVAGANDAPTVPVLLGTDPDLAVSSTPVLEVQASTDIEGDGIEYEFVVSRSEDLSDPNAQVRRVDALTWKVEEPLSGGYWWSARAIDDRGAESDWATPWPLVAVDATWGTTCSVGDGEGASWLLLGLLFGLRRRRR